MRTMRFLMTLMIAGIGFHAAPTPAPRAKSRSFLITIENVQPPRPYLAGGPTEAVLPGAQTQFSFHAGKGQRLTFATMFGQSNDLFYAPKEGGLELYDAAGKALSGDVTDQIELWDAGTEANQEPGKGPDQAPRQTAPNTGPAGNGKIVLAKNAGDGFIYPATRDMIRVEVAHHGDSHFVVTITNLSAKASLTTPFAPGVWAIHDAVHALFSLGQSAPEGLEPLAEDGNNAPLAQILWANSGFVTPFSPGVWAVHEKTTTPFFDNGFPDRGQGLEALVEWGAPTLLFQAAQAVDGVRQAGMFNMPLGTDKPGPLFPGQRYQFTVEAIPGESLNVALMLGQSNDLFLAPNQRGIPLFKGDQPLSEDVTNQFYIWDAGTEVNEYPGAGPNQGPRQNNPEDGVKEAGKVQRVKDSFSYPTVVKMIRVKIQPVNS